MDALSVTASVAGLLQVAAKVISVLSSAVDASATARNVLAEVESLLGIFRQLDDFVVNFADQSMARKSRIYVDDLVVALTGCVCTFSELDRELEGLRMDDGAHGALKNRFGAWRSVKWAVKDQDIAKILRNLQMHKTSLNLLLSIYTCSSTRQVQRDMAELKQFMATVMQAIPDLAERMATARSTESSDDLPSALSWASIRATGCRVDSSITFEQTLAETRVYKRAARHISNGSFKSIRTAESRWSQLTGLSMAQVSNLSVVCLPVRILELNNGYMYHHDHRRTIDSAPSGSVIMVKHQRRSRKGDSRRPRLPSANDRASLLHAAARTGDNVAVWALLKTLGARIQSRDEEGYTALHCAVFFGQGPTVQLLLDYGTNIDAMDKRGGTALHIAANDGRTDIVQQLLDRGASLEAKMNSGHRALHVAAIGGHTAVARLLLDRRADVEAKDNKGWTPFHQAVWSGHTVMVQLLLSHGAGTEAKNFDGWTALHIGVYYGKTDVVHLLLDHGTNIEARTKRGHTALHITAENGETNMVQLLLDRGADIEAETNSGHRALHMAAFGGQTVVAQLLLDRGCRR